MGGPCKRRTIRQNGSHKSASKGGPPVSSILHELATWAATPEAKDCLRRSKRQILTEAPSRNCKKRKAGDEVRSHHVGTLEARLSGQAGSGVSRSGGGVRCGAWRAVRGVRMCGSARMRARAHVRVRARLCVCRVVLCVVCVVLCCVVLCCVVLCCVVLCCVVLCCVVLCCVVLCCVVLCCTCVVSVEHACALCQDQTGALHMFCDTQESESCLVKAPAKHASKSVLVVGELLCTGVQANTERHTGQKTREMCSCW